MREFSRHTNGTDARHVRAIAGWPGREPKMMQRQEGKMLPRRRRRGERPDGISTIPFGVEIGCMRRRIRR
ncbi:hypothetical protein DBV15_05216 [Temnothorax longispinosus]|uniref:Uncharacterized protein n=1 Tax=Temnothorax longispinosus TaxID=300112 RepID=A0A4V3SAV4_9HYME|nr:hypothetical protein DBV15_05216 [Temnothorax longispinosus]